ncbi:MBL fold metallo-hydrolase [Blastomonas fulva]|uniref:MBL fold metallo-hydrolase n=1 Tax=Blastomonas fulva TaxID=1550728 RepID=UPI0025A36FF1|nr:MBL fold metallo-hydrolase [Blastomonas fulva]MDM7929929.1 MBL fold metallo-hydrolase [Blastomonas fulva]MDM7966306.1 MBL fold metallo-hydrolase [Blastomonas fulva]
MRRLVVLLLVVAAIAATLWATRERLGEIAFSRALEASYGKDATDDLEDGLHVILCGTGSPLPDPARSGPCTLVIAGKQVFLVDSGSGAGRRIGQIGVSLGKIDAAFLTHFHSDHIDGLGEVLMLRWASSGRKAALPVFGPQGVERVVAGFDTAYTADYGYRIAHHGADIMPRSGAGARANIITVDGPADKAVVYQREGVRVTAFRVDHDPIEPALGYRFDYKGRSVVISGDTKPTKMVSAMCNGCDVLVHEVLNIDMVNRISAKAKSRGDTRIAKIMADTTNYHSSPVAVAGVARRGKARMLVFTHIVPRMPTRLLHPYYLRGVADAYSGDVVMGEDGMRFSLPARSQAIEQASLL